jgi:hypothetical protein
MKLQTVSGLWLRLLTSPGKGDRCFVTCPASTGRREAMGARMIWIVPGVLLALGATMPVSNPTGDVDVSPYVWAEACKECHQEIYQAWAKSKHKVALFRLSEAERRSECVRCHVTGLGEVIYSRDDAALNGGVQCEACHGPALAHASAATDAFPIIEGLIRPKERECVKCHCEESPHFQFFDYKTLSRFVHPVGDP